MRSSHPALLPPYRPPPAAPPTKLNNLKENTMIDTLLQKYDSLQRKSESLGLSCSDDSFCRQPGKEQIKEEWQRKNEGRLVKVVDKRSGYGGRLENLGGLSDLGYEVTDFDEAHLQHRMEYERDAHCSAQSGYTDSYSLNTYSDALYTFGNETQ